MAEVVESMADEGSFREKASAMRGAAKTRSAMMRVVFALLVIGVGSGAWVIFGGQPAKQTSSDAKFETVTIKDKQFKLELAIDDEHRFKGLSGRTEIKPDEGMLFVFTRPAKQGFVMRDCPIPIDIIYLDGSGRVTAVHKMKPEEPRSEAEKKLTAPYAGAPAWTWTNEQYESRLTQYSSKFAAQFVIELKGDTLDTLKLAEGDQIVLDTAALKKRAK